MFIIIGAGAVVKKDGQVERLGGLVQVEEKRRTATPVRIQGKRNVLKCSKQAKAKAGEKRDKEEGKRQSVRWKAWWR